MSRLRLTKKAYYWATFDGSYALFNSCWRELRQFMREGGYGFDDTCPRAFLEAAAGRRVNNPRSRFYICG